MFVDVYKSALLLTICLHPLVNVHGRKESTGWASKKADIYFLLDSSASIWIMDYLKLLKFVTELVSDMDIGQSTTRVGVGVFSTDHRVHINITNNLNKDMLQEEIMKAPYLKGNTFISRALKGMTEQLLSPGRARPGVPLITVLFTDGMSRHRQLTADNATIAKSEGIFIFTVGIGNGVDHQELRNIASDPKPMYNYHVSDFDALKDIRSQLSLMLSEVDFLQGDEGKCGDKTKMDVVFVFDESALGESDTQKIKVFIASLVNDFSMDSGNVRVGIVSTTCHDGDRALGQYVTKDDFLAGLERRDGPDVSSLVKRARLDSFVQENGARFDAQQRIILILHADVIRRVETVRQVSKAKHAGIEVFVIQLGTSYEKSFVNRLASHTDKTMYPGTADDLTKAASKESFIRMFC